MPFNETLLYEVISKGVLKHALKASKKGGWV